MLNNKVSVIIPTMNRRRQLMNAITSAVNQTYKGEIEIVIVDDSPDYNKIDFILPNNRNIIYMHKAEPKGSPLARNLGASCSTGDFIAFLDDDNGWHPQKLEKQMEVMTEHPACGLIVCYSRDKRFNQDRINRPPEIITHEMILKSFNLSSTSSYLVRRYAFEMVGGFDTFLPSAQEYDLAIRISKYHDIRCVPEVLIEQNTTQGQISENWTRKIRGILAVYRKHRTEYHFQDHIKTLGILFLFTFGYIVGNRIYKIIIPLKSRYEQVAN